MNDVKATVAANIARLRTESGMTQLELATKLNYSDKAVSKWERGDSLPDITVLVALAELFSVSLDTLVREHDPEKLKPTRTNRYSRRAITCVAVVLVWLIATAAFVVMSLPMFDLPAAWLSFVHAVPVSLIVWLVLNSVWLKPRWNYFIISLLTWAALGAAYVTLLAFGLNWWVLFLLGVPAQAIILLWSKIKKK